jgi:hypothetical protein
VTSNSIIAADDANAAAAAAAQADITTHAGSTANPHSVTKAQVGLGNADNTSDANKPVSTATQTALNGKVSVTGQTGTVNLTTATAVTVPAITAANQAARVTAFDAATGRLAIGGIEMGDTGWRRIDAWLGPNWIADTIGTAGFQVRRIGNVVHFRGRVKAKPTASGGSLVGTSRSGQFSEFVTGADSGWIPAGGDLAAVATRQSQTTSGHLRAATTGTLHLTTVAESGNWAESDSIHLAGQRAVTSAWPATLPGVAA